MVVQEEHAANQERLFDLEKRFKYDVDTRAAKAEEQRRMLELQAIKRAAAERDFRAASLLQCNWRMHNARMVNLRM